MATSFSGGRSRSTQREPPTMGNQLVNITTCGCESSASLCYPLFWIVTVFIVCDSYLSMRANIDTRVEVVLVQITVVHVNSGNENDHLCKGQNAPFFQNKKYLPRLRHFVFAKTARLIKRNCMYTQTRRSCVISCNSIFVL